MPSSVQAHPADHVVAAVGHHPIPFEPAADGAWNGDRHHVERFPETGRGPPAILVPPLGAGIAGEREHPAHVHQKPLDAADPAILPRLGAHPRLHRAGQHRRPEGHRAGVLAGHDPAHHLVPRPAGKHLGQGVRLGCPAQGAGLTVAGENQRGGPQNHLPHPPAATGKRDPVPQAAEREAPGKRPGRLGRRVPEAARHRGCRLGPQPPLARRGQHQHGRPTPGERSWPPPSRLLRSVPSHGGPLRPAWVLRVREPVPGDLHASRLHSASWTCTRAPAETPWSVTQRTTTAPSPASVKVPWTVTRSPLAPWPSWRSARSPPGSRKSTE